MINVNSLKDKKEYLIVQLPVVLETIKEITAIPLKLGDVVNYKGHDDVIIYTGKVTKVISYEKYSHIVLTPLDLSDFINQGIKD